MSWSLSLYHQLPAWLQDAAFTLHGWQLRRQRYGRRFRELLAMMRESEWWSADETRAFQTRRLRRVVAHAYETTPHYRDLFERLHLRPGDVREIEDLGKLPVLTKEELRNHGERLLSRSFRRSELREGLTSGSTGKALKLYFTPEAQQAQWAVWWRHRGRFGLRLGDTFLSFGARQAMQLDRSRPPFWRTNYAIGQTYLSTYHLTPQHTPRIVQDLNRTAFDFYVGYPSMMSVLANFMQESGQRLTCRPKVVVCGAESLLPAQESLLREAFGVRVTDQYGAAEGCANMARCEHDRYHEDFEFCIVELVENPADPSGPKRIVGTSLWNFAMPLIRYDLDDLAEWSRDLCPCGRRSRSVLRVDGRSEDYVCTPDGRRASGMNQVFKWVAGAREMQIVQESIEQITVRVVPRATYGPQDEALLLRELRSRLGDRIRIDVQRVEQLERSAGGKLRCVISRLPEGRTTQGLK